MPLWFTFMFKGDDPFFGLLKIKAEEFPAGAFAIFCPVFGGACNYGLSGFLLNKMGIQLPKLQAGITILGIALGIAFALYFISYLTIQE